LENKPVHPHKPDTPKITNCDLSCEKSGTGMPRGEKKNNGGKGEQKSLNKTQKRNSVSDQCSEKTKKNLVKKRAE